MGGQSNVVSGEAESVVVILRLWWRPVGSWVGAGFVKGSWREERRIWDVVVGNEMGRREGYRRRGQVVGHLAKGEKKVSEAFGHSSPKRRPLDRQQFIRLQMGFGDGKQQPDPRR